MSEHRVINPWLIAISVMLGTFMEVLDTTVVNVSLPHIAGSLGATVDEATWVLTSYLVANAIILPMTGWLANRFGRKRILMISIGGFTIASVMCGLAPNLPILLLFRVLQGATGGGLQPLSQAIMLEAFPASKRGKAMAFWGLGIVVAPMLGPVLGGWLTDTYSWRWLFYINVPVGILGLIMSEVFVFDPAYIKKIAAKVDYWGIGLLAVGMGALQIMLDKGQEDDWFSSHFIVSCAVVSVIGLAVFLGREFTVEHPILDLRLLARGNVGMTMLIMFLVGVSLYSTTVLVPQFLQEIMGYSARQAGMAISTGGLVLLLMFPVAGALAPKLDARWLVSLGFVITAIGLWRMTELSLTVSFGMAVSWRAFIAIGLPFLFIPINMLCYTGVPQEKYNDVSGMSALMRNLGGSFGISLVTTLLARSSQHHLTALVAHTTPGNRSFEAIRNGLAAAWMQRGGGAMPDAMLRANAQVFGMAQIQARLLAYVDVIWMMVALTVLLVPLPFLMQKAKKGQGVSVGH